MFFRAPFLPSRIFFLYYFLVISIQIVSSTFGSTIDLFNFKEQSTQEMVYETYKFIVTLVVFIWLSYKITSLKLNFQIEEFNKTNTGLHRRFSLKPFIYILVYSLLIYLSYDGNEYFIREDYLPKDRDKVIYLFASIFGGFTTYIIISNSTPKISILYLTFFLIMTLGAASRFSFVYVVLYFILLFIFYRKQKISFYVLLILLACIYFIYVASLRSLDSHGLINYFSIYNLLSIELINKGLFVIYYIFDYGFYVLTNITQNPPLPVDYFLVAINPLPSFLIDVYDTVEQLRLNVYVPYSSIGELYLYGSSVYVPFAIFLGIILRIIDKMYSDSGINFKPFIILLVLVLSALFWQYNLRSFMRIIYYLLFVFIIYKGFKIFYKKS
jgi:hypothetical protein